MTTRTEMPPIQYRPYIATSPARVYAAIATSEGWDSWFTTKATSAGYLHYIVKLLPRIDTFVRVR